VLQALQEQRKLLFGPEAADLLSVVSGGSYIGSAYIHNARTIASVEALQDDPPFARDTPEEKHVLKNGRYLVTPFWPTLGYALWLLIVNVAGLAAFVVWVGFALGDFGALLRGTRWASWVPPGGEWWQIAGPIIGLLVSVVAAGRAIFGVGRVRRTTSALVAILGIGLLGPMTYAWLAGQSSLGSVAWWVIATFVAVAVAVLALLVTHFLGKFRVAGRVAAIANLGQVWAVRLLMAVIVLGSGTLWYPTITSWLTPEADPVVGLLLLFGTLAAPLILGALMERSQLHRVYRDRIRRSYGVVRTSKTTAEVPAAPALLSDLAPGPGCERIWPKLLICATANVRNRDPRGHWRGFAPFVLSDDQCGTPGTDAVVATKQLERGRVRSSWAPELEPAITLPIAVAATGAAVSPSMGRFTQPTLRASFAALNIRLGWWVPNAFEPGRRREVADRTAPGRFDKHPRLSRGYDQLIPELVGASGPNMYISDGGHYDNLGLIALLRARCAEIWCVDASPEPDGSAEELSRVLLLAEYEVGITHTLDLKAFRATAGYYPTVYTCGQINYRGGGSAALRVIKLGLTNHAPTDLRNYGAANRPFPHHKTSRQWYDYDRSVAYRDLGHWAATACVKAIKGLDTELANPSDSN